MTASSPLQPANSLEERLDFIGFDDATVERLNSISASIMRHIDPALSKFYDKVEQTPQVSRFFEGRGQMDVAQAKQSRHWGAIAAGKLDNDYYESSLRIGNRHAMIGLEPRRYVGGYGLVLETLIKGVMGDWMAEETAKGRRLKPTDMQASAEIMAQALSDMIKAVMIDVDLAVSTYFAALEEKIEDARLAAEERSRVQNEVLARTGKALGALAAGHLDTRIDEDLPADFAQLGADFNAAAESLQDAVVRVRA